MKQFKQDEFNIFNPGLCSNLGNTNKGGRLSTVDLIIEVGCL